MIVLNFPAVRPAGWQAIMICKLWQLRICYCGAMRSSSHHFHKNNEALSHSTSLWGCFCFLCRYLSERGMLSSLRFAKLEVETPTEFTSRPTEHDLFSWMASFEVKKVIRAARQIFQTKPAMHEQTTCAWQLWLTPLNGGGTWFRKEYYYRLSLLPHPNFLPQSRPVHFSLLLHFSSFPLSESLEQAIGWTASGGSLTCD